MSHHILCPAYGRDYKSRQEIEKDLLAERDFILTQMGHSTYVNLQQLDEPDTLQVRYSRLTKIAVFKVKDLRSKQQP